MTRAPTGALLVVNTLPQALRHFEAELLDTLGASRPRESVTFHRFQGDGHKADVAPVRLLRYLAFCRHALRRNHDVLVLWPLLGWLDLLAWGLLTRTRVSVMVHDPTPLRRQFGMDGASWLLVRCLGRVLPRVEIIVLSREAQREVESKLPGFAVRRLPHPVLRPSGSPPSNSGPRGDKPRVLVLGQYKPARDLDLLHQLGPALLARGMHCVVRGKGWPPIPGWDVQDGFLDEADFQHELSDAAVLLVPYKKYFQSGVAIRALESGVPVVGTDTDFLCSLLGENADTLVRSDDLPAWLSAIEAAVASDSHRLDQAVWERVSLAWASP